MTAVPASTVLLPGITGPTELGDLADWTKHKRYCKKLLFVPKSELPAFTDNARKAHPESSTAYQAAYQAAAATGIERELKCVTLAPLAADRLVDCCEKDVLPSGPAEEAMWGLYGKPSSDGYQRLLWLYQKALKYGDLNADKLMECLLARPNTSKALTEALHSVKIVQTEGDSYDQTTHIVDLYHSRVKGLEVVSEFDNS